MASRAVAAALSVLTLAFAALPVAAQTGGPGDPCDPSDYPCDVECVKTMIPSYPLALQQCLLPFVTNFLHGVRCVLNAASEPHCE